MMQVDVVAISVCLLYFLSIRKFCSQISPLKSRACIWGGKGFLSIFRTWTQCSFVDAELARLPSRMSVDLFTN
uniref:Uncharacterized protein n=1 Tax=Meloidogyne enterolobii TaxID=390850 RepID=A0A6V7VJ77_MELEN|nr:unnamed protein product [Meloidogyne enterolobii]